MGRSHLSRSATLRALRLALVGALVASFAACGTSYIANTKIPDTEENRAVYQRVMEYRRAVESRDTNTLEAMLSRAYYENAGTTDRADDDYGFEKVRDTLLPELRDNVLEVQLRILLHRIRIDGDRAYADYEYYYTFRYVEGGIEGW
jgi:hypothetical protein